MHISKLALRLTTAISLAASLPACASHTHDPSSAPIGYADAPLLAKEFAGRSDILTAYDAVRLLRPSFLSMVVMATRGAGYSDATAVYVNASPSGDLDVLKNIPANTIVSIRVIKPMHAMTTLGKGHTGGAIMVETQSHASKLLSSVKASPR